MKIVLMSIRTEWAGKIIHGEKGIEVRKAPPKCELPFRVLIYESGKGGCHKVVGEFTCYKIYRIAKDCNNEYFALSKNKIEDFVYTLGKLDQKGVCEHTCLSVEELDKYANGKALTGIEVSDLVTYFKPKDLSELKGYCKYQKQVNGYNGFFCTCSKANSHLKECKQDKSCGKVLRPPQSWCYIKGV